MPSKSKSSVVEKPKILSNKDALSKIMEHYDSFRDNITNKLGAIKKPYRKNLSEIGGLDKILK